MGFWDMGYGTWDRDVENSHDSMFDMNGDGVLDPFEQSLQIDTFNRQMKDDDSFDEDEEDDDF